MTTLRQRMTEDMRIRNLALNTQISYLQQVSLFARHFNKSPEYLGPEEIRAYQVYLTEERKLAPGSVLIAVAALQTSCLPVPKNSSVNYYAPTSSHTVTPVYSGDDSYQGFTGTSQKFIAVQTPAVMIASSPAALTVTSGTPGTLGLAITSPLGYGYAGKGGVSGNNYTFPISLVCAGLPAHSTCSYAYTTPNANMPSATDINCTGSATQSSSSVACAPVTATITINTNVSAGTAVSQTVRGGTIGWAVMFGFGLLGIVFRRKVGVYGNYMLALGITMLLFGATACSTTNLSPKAVLTTPKGTYNVQVYAIETGSQTINTASGPQIINGSQNPVSIPFSVQLTVQ